MQYTIANEILQVSVETKGAELAAIKHLPTGLNLLWGGDAAVWGGKAPILFPHCGSVHGGVLNAKGQAGESPRHGFARHQEFVLVEQTDTCLRLRLEENAQTLKSYPYHFRLDSIYTVEGNRLTHTIEVYNPAENGGALPFNVGFHPAFAVTDGGAGWEFLFDHVENPLVLETDGDGLLSGIVTRWGDAQEILITDDLFAEDSICFTGLQSHSLSLVQKDTDRSVRVGIDGFPYVLIWGQPKGPHQYVCIEPWHGVPDPAAPYGEFTEKPGITLLQPGETFATSMPMEFTV